MLPDHLSATQIYFTVSSRVAERISGRDLLVASAHGTQPSETDLQVVPYFTMSPMGITHRN